MNDFAADRRRMVARDIAGRGIRGSAVLDAMGRIRREDFVPADLREQSYDDMPLSIGDGQTISQPYIVALMIDAAGLAPDDNVLDVGTGSGYAAAVLGAIAGHVTSIERHADLAESARQRLTDAGCDNVIVLIGDGTAGAAEHGPFDAILAAAAGADVPRAWVEQLAPGGRIVLPLTYPGGAQELMRFTRTPSAGLKRESLGGVRFVPLISGS